MSAVSLTHSPLSPTTPSPNEVDVMLRNTFASTPSPLSQQWSSTTGSSGRSEDCGIYDTLSKKRDNNEQSGVEDRCEWQRRGGKETVRVGKGEDC